MASQRCPCPNPWKLYVILCGQGGFQVAKKLTLKSRVLLDYPGGCNVMTGSLYIGKWETESETGKCTVKKMQPIIAGFAKMKGHKPKNAATSRGGESPQKKETDSSPERNTALLTPFIDQ